MKNKTKDNYSIDFPFHNVVDFNFLQLHLKRKNWREYLKKENPAVAALLCKMDYNKEERKQVKKEFFRMLLKLELDEAKAEILTTFMDNYLKLPPEEEEAVIEDLEEELPEKEVEKLEKLMTSWERKGREEGKAEGKAEGEVNALKTVIINLANQKFGSIEGSTEEKINNISQKEKLEEVVNKIIKLDSEKELIKILETE
ncbi:hypothetical protein [Natranaerofaba carboxydovora]|uniref:hypothetical protein n=1 Tax=Natranaerofaba carboxydovora TaxID=2742683 RepID=UPI001F1386F2|nr:hypothetical protein [Natranaerofaba carboxydovora]UMZ74744.1 hypothetical protein ACONDI_02346 [Natranaerofaba carboxydovora]